jgi:hypothetical protein
MFLALGGAAPPAEIRKSVTEMNADVIDGLTPTVDDRSTRKSERPPPGDDGQSCR